MHHNFYKLLFWLGSVACVTALAGSVAVCVFLFFAPPLALPVIVVEGFAILACFITMKMKDIIRSRTIASNRCPWCGKNVVLVGESTVQCVNCQLQYRTDGRLVSSRVKIKIREVSERGVSVPESSSEVATPPFDSGDADRQPSQPR